MVYLPVKFQPDSSPQSIWINIFCKIISEIHMYEISRKYLFFHTKITISMKTCAQSFWKCQKWLPRRILRLNSSPVYFPSTKTWIFIIFSKNIKEVRFIRIFGSKTQKNSYLFIAESYWAENFHKASTQVYKLLENFQLQSSPQWEVMKFFVFSGIKSISSSVGLWNLKIS